MFELKENIKLILSEYLKKFPAEKERLLLLNNFLKQSSDEELTDWDNPNGHLTVGTFVYCKSENKFLVLYHRDLKMYLYPGGHVDKRDKTLLEAAKRELKEETGLENLDLINVYNTKIPFDIDIHLIPYNERVNMPEHYHFDFRYLFFINRLNDIVLDEEECEDYEWISSDELIKDKNYGNIINKLKRIIDEGYYN